MSEHSTMILQVVDSVRIMHEKCNGITSFVPREARIEIRLPPTIPVESMLEVLSVEYPNWRGWLVVSYETNRGGLYECC